MKIIRLTKNQITFVDYEDYELLSKHKWYAAKFKRPDGSLYYYAACRMTFDGKSKIVLMHMVIMGTLNSNKIVDHKSSITLDNRRINLRIATLGQNAMNQSIQKRLKHSKYKGVTYNKINKNYISYIMVNYKRTYLGAYKCETKAAIIYDIAARKLHGEFAKLNIL